MLNISFLATETYNTTAKYIVKKKIKNPINWKGLP